MKEPLDERYAKADIERDKLRDWFNKECDSLVSELKRTGKYVPGLDTNRKAFAPLKKEYIKRFLALYDKYDLPNKPKFEE